MNIVDLHTHSNQSDGSLSPEQLVLHAKNKGLQLIALTDHDTVAGVDEALSTAQNIGIEFIPGVEISADSICELHILGYFTKNTYRNIIPFLHEVQQTRLDRNEKLLQLLQTMGYNITQDELYTISGGDIIGRPHFAKLMIDKGYFLSIEEVFESLLGEGRPGYIEKVKKTPEEVIAAIFNAGGISGIAHPKLIQISEEEFEKHLVEKWIPAGLRALEVFHSKHSITDQRRFASLCKKFQLLPIGGSDFHGSYKPGLEIGIGYGDLEIPENIGKDILDAIKRVEE